MADGFDVALVARHAQNQDLAAFVAQDQARIRVATFLTAQRRASEVVVPTPGAADHLPAPLSILVSEPRIHPPL